MLWSYRACRRFSTILTFGKHKGKAYDDVIHNHPRYVEWMKTLTHQSSGALEFLNYARTAGTSKADSSTEDAAPVPYRRPEQTADNFRARTTSYKHPHEVSPVTGSCTLTVGKYTGWSFQSVFEKDSRYCLFLATQVHEKMADPNLLHFVIYCQQRWLQPSTETNVITSIEAAAECLKGRKFVVTGSSVGVYSRPKIEKCLEFFGASISSSCTKACEGLLLISTKTIDGRPIEDSSKYKTALSKGVEIMDVSMFLKEKLHNPAENTVAFNLA
eukprot:GEMP01052992.1.p1 GENE.GEMP01052992.1~~GEMP01052992.1.p1  ORF type:complete len:272 (+),score=32.45 GEMP01052992.1:194-1009(+)